MFIPDGLDFKEASKEQGFDDVALTVRALATADYRIVDYLKMITEGQKPKGGSPIDGLTSINKLYNVEAEEFNKALRLKIWSRVAFGNWREFEDAKKFLKNTNLKMNTILN